MKQPALPSLTVVTPSFNQAQFIRETIDSVLAQKYPRLEYWVIDGGSTDGTVDILKSYGDSIHWISEKDTGQTNAINKGLKRSTGDIVCYLNSDDVFLPNALLTVGEYFAGHPRAQWVTGDYFIIDEQGRKMQSYVALYKKWLRRHASLATLSVANYINQPSTFWRRSAMDEVGMLDESLRYCMDYDLWMRLIARWAPSVLDNRFSLFRIHGQSKGGALFRKQFAEEHEVVKRYTRNPLLRGLHLLHAAAIVQIYTILKKNI